MLMNVLKIILGILLGTYSAVELVVNKSLQRKETFDQDPLPNIKFSLVF